MLIGYARVSTDDWNLDLQRDALRLAGYEKIYEDWISGAKAARPDLAMALEVARDEIAIPPANDCGSLQPHGGGADRDAGHETR